MKLNKGEWGELLVGLACLQKGRVALFESNKFLDIDAISYSGSKFIKKSDLKSLDIEDYKKRLLEGVGAFEIPSAFIESLEFKKGGSKNKRDIFLKYIIDGSEVLTDGFGIKSLIAGKPSLLNASAATNFKFEINANVENLKKLKTKSLMQKIDSSSIKFVGCMSEIFLNNLRMVDSRLDEILSKIIVSYYQKKSSSLKQLVEITYKDLDERKIMEKRIKDFLYYICVGMFPSTKWNGDEQIAGTLVFTKNFEMFCLHRVDINNFKKYLYEHSFLDTASTSRHNFGFIYSEGSKSFVNLNLLVRINCKAKKSSEKIV